MIPSLSERQQMAARLQAMARLHRQYPYGLRSHCLEADDMEAGAAALLREQHLAEQIDAIIAGSVVGPGYGSASGDLSIHVARERVRALFRAQETT